MELEKGGGARIPPIGEYRKRAIPEEVAWLAVGSVPSALGLELSVGWYCVEPTAASL